MTEIENSIAQRLNNSIEQMVPNDFDSILSDTSSRIVSAKRIPYFKLGIAALSLCVVIIGGIVIKNNVINANTSGGKPFITGLTGYKQKITLPHCELFFNEGNMSLSHGLSMDSSFNPIYSKSEIVKLLGHDPLKNVWIPSGLTSNYAVKNGDNSNANQAYYYSKTDLAYIAVSYIKHPNSDHSKSIYFAFSNKGPLYADIELPGKTKTSYIYKTKVTITHHSANAKYKFDLYPGKEIFHADFTYKGLKYSFSTINNTQEEFINILMSIIKP